MVLVISGQWIMGLKTKSDIYGVSVNNLHYSYVAPTTPRQPSLTFCYTPLPRLLKLGVFAKMRKRGRLVVYKKLSVRYRKEQAPSLRLVAGLNKVCPHLTSAFVSTRPFATLRVTNLILCHSEQAVAR